MSPLPTCPVQTWTLCKLQHAPEMSIAMQEPLGICSFLRKVADRIARMLLPNKHDSSACSMIDLLAPQEKDQWCTADSYAGWTDIGKSQVSIISWRWFLGCKSYMEINSFWFCSHTWSGLFISPWSHNSPEDTLDPLFSGLFINLPWPHQK